MKNPIWNHKELKRLRRKYSKKAIETYENTSNRRSENQKKKKKKK